MVNIKRAVQDLFARDQLTADGGKLWRGPNGRFRGKRFLKFATGGGAFALSLFLAIASIGLPLPGKVSAARAEASSIYARDGQTLLYKIRGDKNRTPIPFEQMPKCIKDGTVATEDKSFYKHQGLDPRGLGRAVLVNLETSSKAQGGSTITQQLVKNALLSPEQTVTRKAKELVLSLEIEQMFPKDEILQLYLNEIPYGSNAYGIEAAAQTYFGKDAKDLTLAQCATLAGLPRAPTFYSPYNNNDPSRLKNRTLHVLDRMVAEGYLPAGEAEAAKAEVNKGLEFAAAKGEDIKAPHFVFYVREQLEQQYGTKTTQEGGLHVITTLDKPKQDIAEDVIQKNARDKFEGYGASNAALTSIDPKTGQILAMVGSIDYFNIAGEGNVNVATAERQPGSSFKPIVYLAAFKKAYDPNLHLAFNPATLLWDVKTDFGGGYSPNNYDQKFRGPVSARDALQQSLNVPAVKMLDLIGTRTATDLAHQMGITTLTDPDRYGDSLVLGGGEIKLLELNAAYNVIANQGVAPFSESNQNGTFTTATPILEVRDRKGKVLDKYDPGKAREVVSKDLAYQISDILKDDSARAPQFGRGSALTLHGRPDTAAKTGTTDSFRDAWTIGFTPQLSAGVWIGNNDNRPMNRVGGSLGAAPIWQEYMERALEGQPSQAFERPPGIKDVKVDKLTGLLPSSKTGATKSEVFTAENAPRDKNTASTSACSVSGAGLHSERPTNPAWENPVQTYLKSHHLSLNNTSDSKDKNDACGPDVSITSPANGETVTGTITIQAKATSEQGVKSVEFMWDGTAIGSDDTPPFTTSYTVTSKAGSHTISAKATDTDGNSKTATISVTVGKAKEAVTLSLSCSATHVCTGTTSDALTNVLLVNVDTSETISMTGSGTSYTATAPAGWMHVYAQGKDVDGNTIKSSEKTLALSGTLAMLRLVEISYLRDDQYV